MTEYTPFEAKIVKLIAEHIGVPTSDIKPSSQLVADLGFDSLDEVELLMALEDDFDLELNDEELIDTVTVQDVFKVIAKHL